MSRGDRVSFTKRPVFVRHKKREVRIYECSLCCAGNHSCVPNAEASFPDNNFLLHLAALSDISPGEVRRACLIIDAKLGLVMRSKALSVSVSVGITV